MSKVLSKKARDAIDRMIRNDPTMIELNLFGKTSSENYMNAAGAAAVAAALEKNSSLQTLNLGSEWFDFDICLSDCWLLRR